MIKVGFITQIIGVFLFIIMLSYEVFLIPFVYFCFFFNIPVLIKIMIATTNRNIRIASVSFIFFLALFFIMRSDVAFVLNHVLLSMALLYLFYAHAHVYRGKALIISAVINTVIIVLFVVILAVLSFYPLGLLFFAPPVASTMFAIFYASLIVAKIYPNKPITQEEKT